MFFCPPFFLWQTRDDDAKKSPAVLNGKNKKNWKFMPVSNENHQISWHVSCCFSTCLRSVVVIVLFCFFYENATQYETIFFVLFFCGWTETPRTPPRHAQNNNNIVGERKREIYDRRKRDNRPRQKDFWTFEKKRNKCKCFSKPLVCVCVCALEFFWWLLQSSAFPAYPSS